MTRDQMIDALYDEMALLAEEGRDMDCCGCIHDYPPCPDCLTDFNARWTSTENAINAHIDDAEHMNEERNAS